MRLSAHLGVAAYGVDVEDGAVSGEEGVEREAEVGFTDLVGQVGQVESVGMVKKELV